MKISQKIRDEHGDGATAVESGYDAEALAGMKAMSEEFKAQGNKVYLPLAD
ncbi:thiamine biosynthesis protein ThiC [Kitasatospora sp. NPDC059463]|uniref:thiamine biosynthesis protein ThiC n=1 Tax=unclassified Kitasatospora TaxID=2633591 RepID=UPI0036A282A5